MASDTPLSDLMAVYIAEGSSRTWGRFLDEFRVSKLGVRVTGLPEGAVGDFTSPDDHSLSVGMTDHAGGQPMVLAFADPAAFERRFGRRFNATMTGDALLGTALHSADCRGILVNSALTEASVVIDRENAEIMLAAASRARSSGKTWWRLW